MKSSTLYRSSLSKERMVMLERARMANMDMGEIPQYRQQQELPTSELDVLYKNMRSTLKKPISKKTPGVYLGIGFVLGVIFTSLVSLIVGLSSITPDKPIETKQTVAIIPADKTSVPTSVASEEKYTIKAGDTLDKIAFRFYGKYDNLKIEQIQALNNIKDPSKLQIGQVIIVPVDGQ